MSELSRHHEIEFTATAFKTDVRFTDWFKRERDVRGHTTYAKTADEIGIARTVPSLWLSGTPPRIRKMIVLLSQWSGEPIRLIRGMIEYEAKVADLEQIEIRDDSWTPPWRSTPQGRQDQVLKYLGAQIEFFEGQPGALKDLATSLRAAQKHLKESAEGSRHAKKEVEIVRPRQQPSRRVARS